MAKHVTAGEKFRFGAQTYNDMSRLIEKDRASGLSTRSKVNRSNNDYVLLKNISGADVGRFGVLGIAGILFDPATALPAFTARTVFTGQIPGQSHQAGRFLICAEPIRNGAIGRAWADGIVTVRIEVQDESHFYATVKPDDMTQLISADQGLCHILYKETGTGTKWAVVRFSGSIGGDSERWAFLKQAPTTTDAGRLQCRLDDPLTGEIIEVYFTLLNCSGVGGGHLTLTIDTPIRVAKRGDDWWFTGHIEGTEETTCD